MYIHVRQELYSVVVGGSTRQTLAAPHVLLTPLLSLAPIVRLFFSFMKHVKSMCYSEDCTQNSSPQMTLAVSPTVQYTTGSSQA